MMLSPPSDEEIVLAADFDPRFALVLASSFAGSVGVAIIDTNGRDGGTSYEWVEELGWDGETWGPASGSNAGSYGEGGGGRLLYCYGRSEASEVGIEFRGNRHRVPVRNGWWIFAAEGDADTEAPPTLVEPN